MCSAQRATFDEFEEIKEEEEDQHNAHTATSYESAAARCPQTMDLSSSSLKQLRLQYDDVAVLLQRLDTARTGSLSGHLKMSSVVVDVVVTVYPLVVKLSQHIRTSAISNSDFCEFEEDEVSEDESVSDTDDDAKGPRPHIDWRINLRQMRLIRDSVFKIAEFVANLHFDGVSHRNISMNNVFVDATDSTAFYISNYAQYDMDWSWAPHHSPEALLYREGLLPSYSTTASDVWSFGCLLLHIFGEDADHCIHSLNSLRTVSSPLAVQGLLLHHLCITNSSQTKLLSVLSLLQRIFTTESARCSMEDVCSHRFFTSPWDHI